MTTITTHCTYHPGARIERVEREVKIDTVSPHPLIVKRIEMRCSAMLTDPHGSGLQLRCPFIALGYDEAKKESRRCYRCRKKLRVTEDGTLTVKRCANCISKDNRAHRVAREQKRKGARGVYERREKQKAAARV